MRRLRSRRILLLTLLVAGSAASGQDIASLQTKAARGDAQAAYKLGEAYLNGTGVARDDRQALDWLSKSAARGYAEAELALGSMYQRGRGVARDQAEAFRWYKKAADQGNPLAQNMVGLSYKWGDSGVAQDNHQAAKWFLASARQGNKDAQENLQELLSHGLISASEADWHTAKAVQPTNRVSPPKPFTQAEVEKALTGGLTQRRIETLVQKYGVDFKLSASVSKKLEAAGAGHDLLQAINTAQR